jgi:hypothetical protein
MNPTPSAWMAAPLGVVEFEFRGFGFLSDFDIRISDLRLALPFHDPRQLRVVSRHSERTKIPKAAQSLAEMSAD